MSIRITQNNCVGCGRCIEACPGNLIKKDAQGKAVIKHISDCWGCTSCLKECKTGESAFIWEQIWAVQEVRCLSSPKGTFVSGALHRRTAVYRL